MRRSFFRVTATLAALGVVGKAVAQNAPCVDGADARYKAVYQLSEGIDQAVRAIGNLRNRLNDTPGTRIVVVALGHGIDFLVEGTKDAQECPFDAPVAALTSISVEFRVCHDSLMAFKVPEGKLLPKARVMPAGMVKITRLQQEEGFAYIKPQTTHGEGRETQDMDDDAGCGIGSRRCRNGIRPGRQGQHRRRHRTVPRGADRR